jgi:CMP-N,N'-diacetyllegionaminic acid synthase
MIEGKKALGIIPARGGSKGLPGKNIKPICGKPLIAWTIEKALLSKYLDEILVTTDSTEIASVAETLGASVPFLRPAELSTDSATTFSAVKHAIDYYNKSLNRVFDYIVLLEPTSPLREDNDIDNMLEILTKNEGSYDSLISIGEVGEHPSIMKKINGKYIEPFCPELKLTTRRQDNEPAYFPYGVAYMAKTASLINEETFYTKRSGYYLLKRYQNYEIDDLYDFLSIENIMKYEWRIK